MRMPGRTTSTSDSPLLVLTNPPVTTTSQREGYAVAETIMRSAVHAKRQELMGTELIGTPGDMRSTPAAR